MKRWVAVWMIWLMANSVVAAQLCDKPMAEINSPPADSLAVLERVAHTYYTQQDISTAYNEQAFETASQQAKSLKKKTKSSNKFVGKVLDRRGCSTEDALVVLEIDDETQIKKVTDPTGGVTFSRPSKFSSLIVTKEGYSRWASVTGTIDSYQVIFDKELDERFLRGLLVQSNPEEKIWGLLEIVGERQFSLEVEKVYPFIGSFRTELLQVIQSGLFDKSDDRDNSPAARAKDLLEWWHDPSDKPFFTTTSVPVDITEETIEEVCAKWADYHFDVQEKKKGEQRTFHYCDEPILGLDGQHALINFYVRYAIWGYSQKLSILKESDLWKLQMVRDGSHWHSR